MRRRQSRPVKGDLRGSSCGGVNAADADRGVSWVGELSENVR